MLRLSNMTIKATNKSIYFLLIFGDFEEQYLYFLEMIIDKKLSLRMFNSWGSWITEFPCLYYNHTYKNLVTLLYFHTHFFELQYVIKPKRLFVNEKHTSL